MGLPVCHQEASAPQGWEEAEVRCSQGSASGDPSHAAEEETQARSQEEEGREEQAGCCRVCQDPGPEAEGSQGGLLLCVSPRGLSPVSRPPLLTDLIPSDQ